MFNELKDSLDFKNDRHGSVLRIFRNLFDLAHLCGLRFQSLSGDAIHGSVELAQKVPQDAFEVSGCRLSQSLFSRGRLFCEFRASSLAELFLNLVLLRRVLFFLVVVL